MNTTNAGMPKRILIVDDEIMLLDITAQILGLSFGDYTIDTASTVEQATALININQYSLIVTDYGITVSTDDGGQHVCSASKAKNPDVPIIMCTGSMADVDAQQTVLSCHADRFVSKPFPINEFVGMVRELLESSHHLSPQAAAAA